MDAINQSPPFYTPLDGVPLPERTRRGGGRKRKYPWKLLEIGQAFLAPPEEHNSVQSAASSARKRLGRQFYVTIRRGLVHVWRIA